MTIKKSLSLSLDFSGRANNSGQVESLVQRRGQRSQFLNGADDEEHHEETAAPPDPKPSSHHRWDVGESDHLLT